MWDASVGRTGPGQEGSARGQWAARSCRGKGGTGQGRCGAIKGRPGGHVVRAAQTEGSAAATPCPARWIVLGLLAPARPAKTQEPMAVWGRAGAAGASPTLNRHRLSKSLLWSAVQTEEHPQYQRWWNIQGVGPPSRRIPRPGSNLTQSKIKPDAICWSDVHDQNAGIRCDGARRHIYGTRRGDNT